MDDPIPTPLALGHAAAKHLTAGDWELDAEPELESAGRGARSAERPEPPPIQSMSSAPRSALRAPRSDESPPSPEQIAEALLFAGGPPLTAAAFAAAVRVPEDVFRGTVDALARRYRAQNRPYAIEPRDGGFVLAVKPAYRGLRAKLTSGPREARLSQSAVDVLAVVAYRQPVAKAEIDAARGHDSGGVLRQLVRLGLVAVTRRGDAGRAGVGYGTTPRFLTLFGLDSLDDLPRLADAS